MFQSYNLLTGRNPSTKEDNQMHNLTNELVFFHVNNSTYPGHYNNKGVVMGLDSSVH
jgi:hypothetical protein